MRRHGRKLAHERGQGARAPQFNARLADAFEEGDTDAVVALLTGDAWLTMPPEPYEYQGRVAIGAFLSNRAVRRGAPLRLVPTRANGQPALGCYFPSPQTGIARPYGLLVLTFKSDQISAMTWVAHVEALWMSYEAQRSTARLCEINALRATEVFLLAVA